VSGRSPSPPVPTGVELFERGPIRVGTLATARLIRTSRLPQGVLATYRLDPAEPAEFQARIGVLMDRLGAPYRPVPGLWSTVAVLPDRDEFGLLVGLKREHGRARMEAMGAFGRQSGVLVDGAEVRSLLLGYLRQARV